MTACRHNRRQFRYRSGLVCLHRKRRCRLGTAWWPTIMRFTPKVLSTRSISSSIDNLVGAGSLSACNVSSSFNLCRCFLAANESAIPKGAGFIIDDARRSDVARIKRLCDHSIQVFNGMDCIFFAYPAMHIKTVAYDDDSRILGDPASNLPAAPRPLMLDHAEWCLLFPSRLDFIAGKRRVLLKIGRFNQFAVGLINIVAQTYRVTRFECVILARMHITKIARNVHCFMIADKRDDFAALAPCLAFQFLQMPDDL